MSSLFAHAIVGAALAGRDRPWVWRCATAFAALSPDLDYPLEWFAGIHFPIRYTHSLGFCLVVGLAGAAWAVAIGAPRESGLAWRIPVAAFSHLALDSLVAVFPEPWFWPFSRVTYRLPIGILPSAGGLDLGNPYLYRNLALEASVLGPILWLVFRSVAAKPVWRAVACVVSLAFAWVCSGLGRS